MQHTKSCLYWHAQNMLTVAWTATTDNLHQDYGKETMVCMIQIASRTKNILVLNQQHWKTNMHSVSNTYVIQITYWFGQ